VEDGVRDLGAPPRLDVGQQLEFPQVVGALVKSRIAFSRERQIATGLLRSPANDVPADRVRWSTSLASGLLDLVSMKKGGLSMALMLWVLGPFRWRVVASGAHLSIACSAAGPGDIGGRLRGFKSIRAVRRPDEKWSLPGRG
jgi:hypothetical protein